MLINLDMLESMWTSWAVVIQSVLPSLPKRGEGGEEEEDQVPCLCLKGVHQPSNPESKKGPNPLKLTSGGENLLPLGLWGTRMYKPWGMTSNEFL